MREVTDILFTRVWFGPWGGGGGGVEKGIRVSVC